MRMGHRNGKGPRAGKSLDGAAASGPDGAAESGLHGAAASGPDGAAASGPSCAEGRSRALWRKAAVTVTAAFLLTVLYGLIFSFSAQNGEESGSLSYLISEKCVELLNSISGRHWTEVMTRGMAEYFEHPIRKLAHFSEYAVMGGLLYLLWSQWLKKGRGLCALCVVWVFLSAAADEFHQFFVPGRYSSFPDVLLDTAGGIFAVFLCSALPRLFRRHSGGRGRKPIERV